MRESYFEKQFSDINVLDANDYSDAFHNMCDDIMDEKLYIVNAPIYVDEDKTADIYIIIELVDDVNIDTFIEEYNQALQDMTILSSKRTEGSLNPEQPIADTLDKLQEDGICKSYMPVDVFTWWDIPAIEAIKEIMESACNEYDEDEKEDYKCGLDDYVVELDAL